MIRIGVVDDDPGSRAVLMGYLARFEAEQGHHFAIEEFSDGSELTADYRPRFDVIFMDVQMDNLDGFAAARLIREIDPGVILIFVTNHGQFAIRGYEVDALSYLLKPVPYFAFCQELKRSLERLDKDRNGYVLLNIAGDHVRVDVSEIVYVESVKHRLVVHRLEDRLSMVGTLKDMTAQLEPLGFFRCNSYLLVNLRHVVGLQGQDLNLAGGVTLPVSRSRKKPFLEALTVYVGGQHG
ncbi:MAG: LytR/AlgR family response regulator transcription factor [Arachnia sp.]